MILTRATHVLAAYSRIFTYLVRNSRIKSSIIRYCYTSVNVYSLVSVLFVVHAIMLTFARTYFFFIIRSKIARYTARIYLLRVSGNLLAGSLFSWTAIQQSGRFIRIGLSRWRMKIIGIHRYNSLSRTYLREPRCSINVHNRFSFVVFRTLYKVDSFCNRLDSCRFLP